MYIELIELSFFTPHYTLGTGKWTINNNSGRSTVAWINSLCGWNSALEHWAWVRAWSLLHFLLSPSSLSCDVRQHSSNSGSSQTCTLITIFLTTIKYLCKCNVKKVILKDSHIRQVKQAFWYCVVWICNTYSIRSSLHKPAYLDRQWMSPCHDSPATIETTHEN